MSNSFGYIYFFILMVGAGQSILFAIFPPLARDLMMTELQTGIVISMAAFTYFISSIYWGRRVDIVGSKYSLILGVIGYAVFNIAFASVLAIAMNFEVSVIKIFLSLIFARCLFAFFSAAIMPSAQTYLILHSSVEERPKKMAMIGMMFGVGMVIGPAAGSAMVAAGILVPIIFSAIIMLLPLPFALKKIKATIPQQNEKISFEKLRFTDNRIRPYIILMITLYTIFSAIQQIISFTIQDLLFLDAVSTAQWVGISFMVWGISSVFCQGVILQRWKFSGKQLIIMGIFSILLALLILFLAQGIITILIAFIVLGAGFGFSYPGVISSASILYSSQFQGQVTASLQAAMALGFIAGPLMGGGFYTKFGSWIYGVLFLILIVPALYWMVNAKNSVNKLAK